MTSDQPHSKALYFPWINFPNSTWCNRALLYWDEISTITPYDIAIRPEGMAPHMRELIQEELVQHVFPDEFAYYLPTIGVAFSEHLDRLSHELKTRVARFEQRNEVAKLHFAKFTEKIGLELRKRGLAREGEPGWLFVEPTTADEYMALLASALGQRPELSMTPLTDARQSIDIFMTPTEKTDLSLEPLRTELLAHAFPAPLGKVNARDVKEFKMAHGEKLRAFRNFVENSLVEIANVQAPDLRAKKTNEVKERMSIEIEEITSAMQAKKWKQVERGTIEILFAVATGKISSLLRAIWRAVDSGGPSGKSPMAYAAYAQTDLQLGT